MDIGCQLKRNGNLPAEPAAHPNSHLETTRRFSPSTPFTPCRTFTRARSDSQTDGDCSTCMAIFENGAPIGSVKVTKAQIHLAPNQRKASKRTVCCAVARTSTLRQSVRHI